MYLFSVSFMMVEALEENVMKDILNMGLETLGEKKREEKHHHQPGAGLFLGSLRN